MTTTQQYTFTAPEAFCTFTDGRGGICGHPATICRQLGGMEDAYTLCAEHEIDDAEILELSPEALSDTDRPVGTALSLWLVDEGDAQDLGDNATSALVAELGMDWETYGGDWLIVWAVSRGNATQLAQAHDLGNCDIDAVIGVVDGEVQNR